MTILIAEDNPDSAHYFRTALAEANEAVLVVADGAEAWRVIQERPDIRIVISDWMMPRIDGLELCRRVRALANHPYVYFILVTARAMRDDKLEGLAAGADDYLSKPIDKAELVARVNVARRLLAAQDEIRRRTEDLEKLHLELQSQNAQLTELATSDSLTGLKNHRFFQAALESAVSFANRQRLPLSLVMVDVDHFKAFNDTFGHPAGDLVLVTVARILREAVREHDIVARYGGEEFVLLLPATDANAACSVAERLREAIAAAQWPKRPINASFGVATTNPKVATPARLVELADRALYLAKSQGRDQTAHADELDQPQIANILAFPTPRNPMD